MHTSYAYIVVVCIPLLSSCIHTLVLRLVLLASILYAYSVFHTSCTEFLCACHNVMSKLSDTVRYLGRVSCHLSPVTCHLSPVTCHHLSPNQKTRTQKPECLHNRKHKCNRRSTNGLRDYELSRLSNTTATKSVVRGVVVVMRSD